VLPLSQKIPIAIFLVLCAIALGAFFLPGEAQQGAGKQSGTVSENPAQNPLSEQRKSYGFTPAVFSQLPSPPDDFNAVVTHYLNTGTPDESFFSKKYYLQPEFYPSFLSSGINYWSDPSPTHWAAYGYGSFPVKKSISASANKESTVTFFVHSGFGVRSYQGMALRAETDSADANLSVRLSEGEFLLGPSFPSFESSWARPVQVNIIANAQGTHTIKIFAARPSQSASEEWDAIAARKNLPYFDAGLVSSDKPLIEISLETE